MRNVINSVFIVLDCKLFGLTIINDLPIDFPIGNVNNRNKRNKCNKSHNFLFIKVTKFIS